MYQVHDVPRFGLATMTNVSVVIRLLHGFSERQLILTASVDTGLVVDWHRFFTRRLSGA